MAKKKVVKKLFQGTKAIVMGLGLHGGGVATAKWLAKNGARVTATDKRTKEVLAPSLRALRGVPVTYVLGEHRKQDFKTNDLIVVNPGVPRESEFLAVAQRAKKRIENDTSLFFRYNKRPVIAVTGTRGKTTTTLWIAELMKKSYPKVAPCGNTPDNAFLKEFDRVRDAHTPVVAEMSSWQLEHLPTSGKSPHIAVITNLFPDHLNRYGGMNDYADAKANIFFGQTKDNVLVLNYDNRWTNYFLRKKPKAKIFFVSTKALPKRLHGVFLHEDKAIFRGEGYEHTLFPVTRFREQYGEHNVANMLMATLAVKLFDRTTSMTERDILNLVAPHMRQEVVYQKGRLTTVNDSCATSPDGTIAAIERFRKLGNLVLIAGGTDKELEFADLAKVIKKHIPYNGPDSKLILLEGSATTKLLAKLQKLSRSDLDITGLKNLDSCVVEALRVAKNLQKQNRKKSIILFSPGAASFEKFLHEFDRGEQFNKLVKKYTR